LKTFSHEQQEAERVVEQNKRVCKEKSSKIDNTPERIKEMLIAALKLN